MKVLGLRLATLLFALTPTWLGCGGNDASPTPRNSGGSVGATGGASANGGAGNQAGSIGQGGVTAQGGTSVGGNTTGQGGSSAGAGAMGGGGAAGQGGSSQGGSGAGGMGLAGTSGGGSTGQAGAAGTAGQGGKGGAGGQGGAGQGGASTNQGLHIEGRFLVDGNGERVVLRGPELVYRWGTYAGLTATGVDVPWEGGRNGNVGAAEIREIAKTKANALRLFGGSASEIDGYLKTAIVDEKMFVAIARVNWADSGIQAVLKKYAKYLLLHPRGEFTYAVQNDADARKWRTEALNAVAYIRSLGFTSPIEIGTTSYGQNWTTIATYGKDVAASDPLKNTMFLLQLYSEHAKEVTSIVDQVAAFPYPVIVDACLYQGGINDGYGNTSNTYKEVWDKSLTKELSSFYWDWIGDGEGNSATTNGTLAGVNSIGRYIVYDSPAALMNTKKTSFLLNAAVP